MRKIFVLLLALCLCFPCLAACGSEEKGTDGLEYTFLSDGTFSVNAGSARDLEEIIIPATHEGKKVTVIEDAGFKNVSNMKQVTIPDTVTTIGYEAFKGCTSLETVKIPEGVKHIGNEMFRDCESLVNVNIPNSVTSIGDDVFYGCKNLEYNEYKGALYLGNYNNPYLVLVKVKDSSVAECEINANTRFILERAFYNCVNLNGLTIPDGVMGIGYQAFYGCTSLTGVTIPDSVTKIGDQAFEGCTSLKYATVGKGVTSIGYRVFGECESLESITLPFVGKTEDEIIYNYFGYIFGAISYSDQNTYIPASLKSVEITGEASFADSAFIDCVNLTSIKISGNMRSIPHRAFYGCKGLELVVIPGTVLSIGDNAFCDIENLTIEYDGTMASWNSIEKGEDWYVSNTELIIYCSDGELEIGK